MGSREDTAVRVCLSEARQGRRGAIVSFASEQGGANGDDAGTDRVFCADLS